jgi:hypothetical protein
MVEVEVLKSNKMGVYAVYENAIRLMVPRDLHLGDEEFDALKVGDRIKVEIQKSRFQLRDPFIVSVGMYRGMSGMPTRVNVAPVAVNSEVPKNEVVAMPEEEDADVSGDEDTGEASEGAEGAEEDEEEEAKEE